MSDYGEDYDYEPEQVPGSTFKAMSDLASEEALIGACLLSTDARNVAQAIVDTADFYKPAHGHIFDAIMGLHNNGDGVDALTVFEELKRHGLSDAIGGAATLVLLQSATPATSNAGKYAKSVARYSDLRRIQKAVGDIVQEIDSNKDPDLIIEGAVSSLKDVGSGRSDALPSNVFRMADFLDRPPEQRPPWIIPGIVRVGWRIILTATEGAGKGLALSTELPCPNGWTTIGEVVEGDELFDMDGNVVTVTAVSNIHHRPCFEVKFSDGSVLIADDQHRWVVTDYQSRQRDHGLSVVQTTDLLSGLRAREGAVANFAIPVPGALKTDSSSLPIHPYVLGAWLGDGSKGQPYMHSRDDEIRQEFEHLGYLTRFTEEFVWRFEDPSWGMAIEKGLSLFEDGYKLTAAAIGAGCNVDTLSNRMKEAGIDPGRGGRKWNGEPTFQPKKVQRQLSDLGVLNDKHIPIAYLRSSFEQRTSLLQGLMDTDGSITTNGRCSIDLCNEHLARDVCELITSLGIQCSIREADATLCGRVVGRRWRMNFHPDGLQIFRLPRKASRVSIRSTRRGLYRYVTSVTEVESVPTKCLTVGSPSSTYLAGRSMIPTHNTYLLRQLAASAAAGIHAFNTSQQIPAQRVLLVDLENPAEHIDNSMEMIQKVCENSPQYDPDNFMLWHAPEGIDLRSRSDRSQFDNLLGDFNPDLVCLGPIYKSYSLGARETDEIAVREVQRTLDDLRTRHSFGLVMEHHSAKSAGGNKRSLDPYGTVFWMRWPELGIGMEARLESDDVLMGRWRGDRLPNGWPDSVERSTPWPWTGRWENGMPWRQDGREPVLSTSAPKLRQPPPIDDF